MFSRRFGAGLGHQSHKGARSGQTAQVNRYSNYGCYHVAKLSKMIERYCTENGIEIPPGFYRRSASRYAIVMQTGASGDRKLIARTWFKVADVLYYLDNFAPGEPFQILDFQKMRVLKREGNRLMESGLIDLHA